MEESKTAPFGILMGLAVSIGIILLSKSNLGANPGFAWLFKPFLWVFVPISLIAILAGATVAALLAVKSAIVNTCSYVGFITGMYTCIAFIFNEENIKNILLSLVISFFIYTFYSFVIGSIVGAIKYRQDYSHT
jgi:hypothetical protein